MLSSGDTTDILTMKNLLSYSNYALRDQLVDLTDHIGSLDIAPAQESYDMYDVEGKTYAQPYRTDFGSCIITKMFDEAGLDYPSNITWDEYEELAKQLTKPDEQIYGAYQHTWRSTTQAIAAAQNGANLIDPQYDYLEAYYDRALRMQDEKRKWTLGQQNQRKLRINHNLKMKKQP